MYQVTIKVLVSAPKGSYSRAAERLVHEAAQELLVGNTLNLDDGSGQLEIVGASAESISKVADN